MTLSKKDLAEVLAELKAFDACDAVRRYMTPPDNLNEALSKFWDSCPSAQSNFIVPDSPELDEAPQEVSDLLIPLLFSLRDWFQYQAADTPRDVFSVLLKEEGYRSGEFDNGDYFFNWVETKHGILIVC